MLKIVYITLLMITSIPLGILFSRLLKWERPITKKYFPSIIWILAIASAVLLSINLIYALTTIYLFFMILIWWKLGKNN
jgi:hypothetical protein